MKFQLAPALKNLKGLNIHRLLRKSFIERLVLVLRIAMLVGVAAVIFFTTRLVWSTTRMGDEKIAEFRRKVEQAQKSTSSVGKQEKTKVDVNALVRKNPFGPMGVPSPTPAPQATPKQSTLPMTLIGTFISTGQAPYAIIEEQKKKTQDVFNLNEMVFGEAKLVAILSDRVEIERNGKVEVLTLDSVPDAAAPEMKGGVAAVDENEFVVDGAELDKALENLPLLLTQARAVPYFKEGRAVGLRLFAIKGGSLFERLGMQNGDVLKSVNGNSLADLSQALQLFQKLKEERSISLTMERNMQEREVRYQIR